MEPFTILTVLLVLAALFSYANHRWIGLPTTVGLTLLSLLLSLILVAAGWLGLPYIDAQRHALGSVDFSQTLLGGALSFLLFAGALNVEAGELREQRWRVLILAIGSTLLSVFLVAGLAWLIFRLVGAQLPLLWCLIFGALISPTDPVSVLALLKQADAPAALSTKFAGEALFNDGVGIVGFVLFTGSLSTGPQVDVNWLHALGLLVREAGGGIVLGLALGWVTIRFIKEVNNYQVEVLLTLALVSGGYTLAQALHTSGPIATACAGILIGNLGRKHFMSEETRQNLDTFWELIDEILNAMLFVLVGLEIVSLKYQPGYLTAALLMVPAVLLARLVSVGAPAGVLRLFRRPVSGGDILLLSWGGLRGAVSVALALSLPGGRERDFLLAATYAVVTFSILVQGTTLPRLLRRIIKPAAEQEELALEES